MPRTYVHQLLESIFQRAGQSLGASNNLLPLIFLLFNGREAQQLATSRHCCHLGPQNLVFNTVHLFIFSSIHPRKASQKYK